MSCKFQDNYIVDKITSIRGMVSKARRIREEDKEAIIGVTNGCFDLLHPGHLHILYSLAERVHYVFVLVNDDESVRKLKGEGRPIIPIEDRLRILASIEVVDYVASFHGESPMDAISMIQPDILAKGDDWEGKEIRSSKFAKETIFIEQYRDYSTSSLIRKCHEAFMNKEIKKLTQKILEEVEDETEG